MSEKKCNYKNRKAWHVVTFCILLSIHTFMLIIYPQLVCKPLCCWCCGYWGHHWCCQTPTQQGRKRLKSLFHALRHAPVCMMTTAWSSTCTAVLGTSLKSHLTCPHPLILSGWMATCSPQSQQWLLRIFPTWTSWICRVVSWWHLTLRLLKDSGCLHTFTLSEIACGCYQVQSFRTHLTLPHLVCITTSSFVLRKDCLRDSHTCGFST